MQTSSVLQQSLNQMQRSFYSDPQCQSSISSKPLINTSTYTHFGPPRQHTTVNMSTQQLALSNISKADLPYRSLASLGVLSK